jgi:hypothetical protein
MQAPTLFANGLLVCLFLLVRQRSLFQQADVLSLASREISEVLCDGGKGRGLSDLYQLAMRHGE